MEVSWAPHFAIGDDRNIGNGVYLRQLLPVSGRFIAIFFGTGVNSDCVGASLIDGGDYFCKAAAVFEA